MGMLDLIHRAREKDAAAARKLEKSLNARLAAAGLPPKDASDFTLGKPSTLRGWDVIKTLLEREGGLTPVEEEKIQRGRESVCIEEAVTAHRARGGTADDPFERWNAIVSLGLDSDPHYLVEKEKAVEEAESRLISERSAAIRERVAAGESLPDPEWPDGEPIPPRLATTGYGALIEWEAIRQLGLSDSPRYQLCRKAAMDAMGDVSRRRGDFGKLLESYRQETAASKPESQQPGVPNGFVETEIFIPLAAFANPRRGIWVVRYHPEFGLVQGRILEDSCYDRGAGDYPGSRGKRVKEFRPIVSLLLNDVNFRMCKGLRKKSVWRVAGEPPLIIGRDKATAATFDALAYPPRFDSRDDAECFLRGVTDSLLFGRPYRSRLHALATHTGLDFSQGRSPIGNPSAASGSLSFLAEYRLRY